MCNCVQIPYDKRGDLPMKRIINTFKYGEKSVKRALALAIAAGVATLAFAVMALVMSNMLCFFIAIMAAFITISLVQTFMIAEGANPVVVRPADVGTESSAHMDIKQEMPPDKPKEKKEKVKKQKAKKEKSERKQRPEKKIKEKDAHKVVEQSTSEEQEGKIEKQDFSQDDIHLYSRHDALEVSKLLDDSALDKNEDNNSDVTKKQEKRQVITEETANTYTKKKIKKTLHKYKVIKDHRMVMIDKCAKYNIYQTPAYVWINENQFHILLIEETPRLLMLPLFRITEITYLKKQPADEEKDYALFKKNTILTDSFRPYLPDYNHSNKTTDLTAYKNLYGIGPGIYFTNNSAKNLFDLLGVEFLVDDKVTASNKVNLYFKDAYKANIKLRDNVLDAIGYADSITKILDDMAHSTISHNEFKDTLNLMIKNKLITDEYANHYMDVRNSLRG